MSITAEAQQDLWSGAQLCCSVLDSIGGAESYSVSVSWVGSPANVQGFDSVPAPQSQKNLQEEKSFLVKLIKKGARKKAQYIEYSVSVLKIIIIIIIWVNKTDLSCLMNSTSCPWWHFLMQFTQMALRSVVLQVWHLWGPKLRLLTITEQTNSWGYSSHLYCKYKQKLPVKIVHWVAGVTWNLVQALTSTDSLFNGILIVHYFIIWGREQNSVKYRSKCDPLTGNSEFVRKMSPREYLSL